MGCRTDDQVLVLVAEGQCSLVLLLVGDGLSPDELCLFLAVHQHLVAVFRDHQELVVSAEFGRGNDAHEADDLLENGLAVGSLVDANLLEAVVSHQHPQVVGD